MAGVLAPPPARSGEPAVHRVLIEKFKFVPSRLEIRVGDKVEWQNQDIAPHTATAIDKAWNSGNLTKGQSAAIRFSAPGSFAYLCTYHPHMRGKIVVVEEPAGDM
ncbi:MAG: cupredoxin family copper-binding protein [Rhodospirillales bacterium]|nr:cupredoxin family copper-binding protein [Rhodospirillales bacterium]